MKISRVQLHSVASSRRAFTLVEIAICLGIIGIALVAIIGILPAGLHTQQDSREETMVSQDASMLLEAVRNGTHGADDLTNFVYAIINVGANPQGYTNVLAGRVGFQPNNFPGIPAANWHLALTNGANIIGLMSTPEFIGAVNNPGYADSFTNRPIPSLFFGGISNHIVAYVSAISGLVSDKPPQDNDILRSDTFAYRVYCVNAAVPLDTNLFAPVWTGQTTGKVFYNWTYWQAAANTAAGDVPGVSPNWVKVPAYPFEIAANQRDLRMTFFWPLLPNGKTGKGVQTYRATIGGQLTATNNFGWPLYFYQPQNFNAAH